MDGAAGISGSDNNKLQTQNISNMEEGWEQGLDGVNQPNVAMAPEVEKVVQDMIGNMAIEAIKMHNPAKKISMDGDD